MRGFLTHISGLLAEAVLELFLWGWTHLVCHCHNRFLLFLRLLRSILLNHDLLLNDRFTVLVLLVLINYITSPGVEILLTRISPGTLHTETLVISGSEAACLSHAAEIIIRETKSSILECSLIILLTLIGLRSPLLELWLSDPFDPATLTLVIFTIHVCADYTPSKIRGLMRPCPTEIIPIARAALLCCSVCLTSIDLNYGRSLVC